MLYKTESTDHCFLRCQNYVSFRTALMNELSSINCEIVSLRPSALPEAILYGDKTLLIKESLCPKILGRTDLMLPKRVFLSGK